jgi:hypothetical protein
VYPGHPRKQGLVFVNKHTQPSEEPCFGSFLDSLYGKLDAQALIQAAAVHQTGKEKKGNGFRLSVSVNDVFEFFFSGEQRAYFIFSGDTHAAIYDYGNDHFYVTSASIFDPVKGTVPAYERAWTRFTMSALWNEPQPSL